ncbi:MAG: class I SAM-dependent rRNA methyltransferase [Myxococcota bacterium]
MTTIRLRSGHVQPIWAGHPWVFAQAIEDTEGAPAPGDVVSVVDARGKFIGRGYWSPKSAIPVRILTRDPEDPLDAASLGQRIDEAYAWRRDLLSLPSEETTGYRLIHAEGDGLAGLVVDVYGDVAAVQFLTVGMKHREAEIIGHVARVTGARSVVEIASERMQRLEGFAAETQTVRGEDVDKLTFLERGLGFTVNLRSSQKTGFFFDQRENRATVESLAQDRRVLDAFCYIGGFSFAAARGGAREVLALDSSAEAITAGLMMAAERGLSDRVQFSREDLKKSLPDLHRKKERFDLAIVDPPKLAPTSRHLEAGRKAYRRLNAQALRLVERGGLMLTCSCSAAVRPGDFLRTLGLAARDANRNIVLLSMGQQGGDHPVPPSFPEGRYLKSALLRVT